VHGFETIVVSQSDSTEFGVHNDRPVFGGGCISEVELSHNLDRLASFHNEIFELVAASSPGASVRIVRNLDRVLV
jgi:hypothetical protein